MTRVLITKENGEIHIREINLSEEENKLYKKLRYDFFCPPCYLKVNRRKKNFIGRFLLDIYIRFFADEKEVDRSIIEMLAKKEEAYQELKKFALEMDKKYEKYEEESLV